MKTQNKKRGFTIVELVIVIAVIAILAGVLVPTFSGIVNKAKKSAALQKATSAYHVLLSEDGAENDMFASANNPDLYIVADGYVFQVEGGQISETNKKVDDIEDDYTEYEGMEETINGVTIYKK